MAGNYNIENVLIQARAKLLENGIKLWLPPYYVEGIGAVDAELEVSVSYRTCNFCVCKYSKSSCDSLLTFFSKGI